MLLQPSFPKQAGIQKVNGDALFLDLVQASLDPRFRGGGERERAGMAEKSGDGGKERERWKREEKSPNPTDFI